MKAGARAVVDWRRVAVLVLFVLSALAFALAPLALPDGYDWVSQTTSEAAAQGVEGAWAARFGFLFFGFGVLALALVLGSVWGRWGGAAFAAFAVLMIATAAFSDRPWEDEAPFDRTEDLLHSATATGMGFAFAIGVVAVAVRRQGPWPPRRALDIAAVSASVVIPLSMSVAPDYAGLLQRAMFLIVYSWFATEALFTVSPLESSMALPASDGPGGER
jgi:hypothetical protein